MPRPNLSLEKIAFTLAALSVAACTPKSSPAEAVKSDQAPTASAAPAAPPPDPGAAANEEKKQGGPLPSATASAAEVPHPALQRNKHEATGHGGSSGSASCGAGTCTADMKKK